MSDAASNDCSRVRLNDHAATCEGVPNERQFVIVPHLEMREVGIAPIAAPEKAEAFAVCTELLVFGIDGLGSHLLLVDEIIDILTFCIKDADIPGYSEVVIASARACSQGAAL